MYWNEIIIDTQPEAIDFLIELLTDLGLSGFVTEDEHDFNDFLENNKQYWDYVDESLSDSYSGISRIKFYLPADDSGDRTFVDIKYQLRCFSTVNPGFAPLGISSSPVENTDWETNWKQYYKPLEIGKKLLILPAWEDSPELSTDRTKLLLDPGISFGTGDHATTALCLQAIEQLIYPDCSVLDLGCGSGILAIAAVLLGANSSIGLDIDPLSADIARQNAELNGLSENRCRFANGNILDPELLERAVESRRFDIVVANIVADVIIPLSSFVRRFMSDNNVFVCSGIIDTREDDVKNALFNNGFDIIKRFEENGWICFICRLK